MNARERRAAYMRELRARLVPPPAGDERHGRVSTYTNRGCRCEPCRGAMARAAADRRAVARLPRGSRL